MSPRRRRPVPREERAHRRKTRPAKACKLCGRVLEHDDELEFKMCEGCQAAEFSETIYDQDVD